MRIKYIVPFPLDEEAVRKRAAQVPKKLIHKGFEIIFVPVKNGGDWLDSYYDGTLQDFFIFEEGVKAEEEGYDAVCIDTMSDSGLQPLRSRLKIPVIAPGIVTMHVAGILGHKFSVVTLWERWIALYKKHLNEYHLWDRCASLRDIGEVPDLAQLLTGKEETTFKKLEETCGKCIDEDGADVIILGSTTMHQSAKYLQERLPVPVLNPGLVAYKVAEMLVELGLSHSKHAYPTPTTLKDEMVLAMAAAVSTRKGKDIAVKA